ncbi:MAG: orotate phosphoribosyltransferase [Fibrobacter sp.]|jgi:orotate phosphoribosyltransferase|nr:orotate phosphoribosyltransferase [Fibrobacter sp.]
MPIKNSFVSFLIETGALKFGDFVTKSGRKTPYFINTGEFRTGAALARLAEFYAAAFVEHFNGKAENLYGPAYKGIPLCAATAMTLSTSHQMNLSFTYNRKEAKDHGEGGSLVGDTYKTPTRIVIIEDVITAGTSINETMQILSQIPNARLKGLLISVDRKERLENGKSALQSVKELYGIEACSIITIDDIISFLKDSANREKLNLPENLLERISDYRKEWGVSCS